MEGTNTKKIGSKQLGFVVVAVVLAVAILVVVGTNLTAKESKMEVNLTATLEKIVKTSDLSTAEFLYQGIVEIPNPKRRPKRIIIFIIMHRSMQALISAKLNL